MVILGRIHAATDYDLSVSLPGRLSGHIQVTDISNKYIGFLQSLSESSIDNPTDFKLLSSLFKRGNYIVCYVKSIDTEAKKQVTLSIEPELINQYLNPGKLSKFSKIVCSINGVEDHGYTVDTGMVNLRGFLNTKDVEDGVQYFPGQQIFCTITSIESTDNIWKVSLSTKTKHKSSTVSTDGQSVDALVPGTKFNLTVKKQIPGGLQVTFNDDNIGCINQLYLEMPLSQYEEGTNIVGCLMYVIPIVKIAFFTQLTLDEEKPVIDSGEIIKNAKFLFRDSKAVVLSLAEGIRAVVPFRRTEIDFDKIPSSFVKDSIHKCRILSYDLMDQVHVCTMQKQMLKSTYKTAEILKIGEVIDVQIMNYKPDGFIFVRAGNIMGDVPTEDIMDIGKNNQTKPKEGETRRARVLGKTDQGNRFLFTLKKSLVESQLPILSNFNDAKRGDVYAGTVVNVNHQGLLIKFFGDVKGWLPIQALRIKSKSAEDYKHGEVINVKIQKIKEDKKLLLSLAQADKIKKQKNIQAIINLEIGDQVKGIVVESDSSGIYLEIEVEDKKKTIVGFLPVGHISPFHEIGSSLASCYVVGDSVTAFVFSTSPEFLLTQTFLPSKKYTSIKRVQLNSCLPVSIKEISKDGLKVILPIKGMKTYGFVDLKQVKNVDLLTNYSIIFGKVTMINKIDDTIKLSSLLKDVLPTSNGTADIKVPAVDTLAMYFNKIKDLSEHKTVRCQPISSIYLGQEVSGVVEKVTENGLVLKLDNDISGIVRKDQFKDNFKVGNKVTGSVLWINYVHNVAEVTLLPHLASGCKKNHIGWTTKTNNSPIKGEIILVTSWFALVRLHNHLGALPIRRHLNDMKPDISTYKIGQKIRCNVVVSNPDCLLPICLLKNDFKKLLDTTLPVKLSLKRKSHDKKDNASVSPVKKIKVDTKIENSIGKESESKKNKHKLNQAHEKDCKVTHEQAENNGMDVNLNPTSDDEADVQPKMKKTKLTAKEKKKQEQQKKKSDIKNKQDTSVDNETLNSDDQFDRLISECPEDLSAWLQYINFHLQAANIGKCCVIAERGLKTIKDKTKATALFEKLLESCPKRVNIWMCYINSLTEIGDSDSAR